jgi:hypothetical protein
LKKKEMDRKEQEGDEMLIVYSFMLQLNRNFILPVADALQC